MNPYNIAYFHGFTSACREKIAEVHATDPEFARAVYEMHREAAKVASVDPRLIGAGIGAVGGGAAGALVSDENRLRNTLIGMGGGGLLGAGIGHLTMGTPAAAGAAAHAPTSTPHAPASSTPHVSAPSQGAPSFESWAKGLGWEGYGKDFLEPMREFHRDFPEVARLVGNDPTAAMRAHTMARTLKDNAGGMNVDQYRHMFPEPWAQALFDKHNSRVPQLTRA